MALSTATHPGLGRRVLAACWPWVLPTALVSAWWILSADSTSQYFPPLASIMEAFERLWLSEMFITDALPSIANFAAGYVFATVIGVGLGFLIGLVAALTAAMAPILEFLRAVPGVALLPAAVILLGIGPSMQISMIVWGSVWPILLNSIDGVRSVDPTVRDVARSYQVRRRDLIWRVVLPAASPQIVTGMRTALAIGITVIVFSEMVGSTEGIGYQILVAQRSFAVTDMWAGMIFLGILGYVANVAFRIAERRLLRWHRGMREASK